MPLRYQLKKVATTLQEERRLEISGGPRKRKGMMGGSFEKRKCIGKGKQRGENEGNVKYDSKKKGKRGGRIVLYLARRPIPGGPD